MSCELPDELFPGGLLARRPKQGRTTCNRSPQVRQKIRICLAPVQETGERLIVAHRADAPLELFKLDGRPHLAWVRVETTQVSSYQALLTEASL